MRLTTHNDRIAVTAQRSPVWIAVLVSAALLLVFSLDRATAAAPVQHLYYAPIILAGFRFKRRGGAIAALASILLYHLANPHLLTFRYEEQDLVQVALFLTVGVVTAKLAHDRDRLRQLALTDDLTGLHNLRSFEAHLAAMVRAARETQAPLALLVLDVDRLKALNDLDVGEALFRAADAALYRAKASGRHRAWVHDGDGPDGPSDRSGDRSPGQRGQR